MKNSSKNHQVSPSQKNIQLFQGPIPPPSILSEYAKIDPSFPERILAMTEKQGEHRREMESLKLQTEIDNIKKTFLEARIGQICAFLIAVSAIAASVIISVYGHPIAGSSVGLGGIAAIIYAFIKGRKPK